MGIYPMLPKLFSIQCMPRTPFAVVATPEAQVSLEKRFIRLKEITFYDNFVWRSNVVLLYVIVAPHFFVEVLADYHFTFNCHFFSSLAKYACICLSQAAAAPAAYYLGGSGDGTRPGTFFVNTSNLSSRPTYEVAI